MSWKSDIFQGELPTPGNKATVRGHNLWNDDGVFRDLSFVEAGQAQTADAFGFKWHQHGTYDLENPKIAEIHYGWVEERYGRRDFIPYIESVDGSVPLVLDAGCGRGFSARALIGGHLKNVRYVGADISTAVNIAAAEVGPIAPESVFLQADLANLPVKDEIADFAFAEGVLHHTRSTRGSLGALVRKVKRGGRIAFYVYVKKSPIREFTDDYIRAEISRMTPEEGWKAIEPLTKLGIALGELNIEVDVPEAVDVLGIPKGKINLQRLFYNHIVKAYYRPEFSFADSQHTNFDWHAPTYSHRQTPEEVREWCEELNLGVELFKVDQSGITVVAKRG